jgi:hypothetical protein
MHYLGLHLSAHRLRRSDFQHLEDKIVGKLGVGNWKNVTLVGITVLVHVVLTLQAICVSVYHITSLELPKEVPKKIMSLLLANLWDGCDKVTRRKCKVKWDIVCRLTKIAGLGIMNLENNYNRSYATMDLS